MVRITSGRVIVATAPAVGAARDLRLAPGG